jgi:hypothetical protein
VLRVCKWRARRTWHPTSLKCVCALACTHVLPSCAPQLVLLCKHVARSGLLPSLSIAYTYYEALCLALFAAVLVYDVRALLTARDMTMAVPSSAAHVNLWDLGGHLRSETGM